MTEQDFYSLIAEELKIRAFQVVNTVELLDADNTVPFISRYRKERTGSLDEEQIRAIEERIKYLRLLEERRATILNSIDEQGKLTPDLKKRILSAKKMQELEDLYLPYKPKKRTRATIAREKGLEPLAEMMLTQALASGDPLQFAAEYIDAEKEVHSAEEALAGACDIVAETMSDDADVRKAIREKTNRSGFVVSKARSPEAENDYEIYCDYSEPISKIVPHRILALNRGEREKMLSVGIDVESEAMLAIISSQYIRNRSSIFTNYLVAAAEDSYKRLISKSIEREIRAALSEVADTHAIQVFAQNLRSLLLQPPVRGKMIMGIDPGFRTGSKVAVIDETGKYLEGGTIYPHPPQNKVFESKSYLRKLIETYRIDIIAIGNGTASRETESLVAEMIAEIKAAGGEHLPVYIIVNEAGASVYSASKVAKEEFPELEASLRGNISIARRLMDPLAELVKIDPKHIGVGLYQHDVNQKNLDGALTTVVESAVNRVGVDLNTASASLLKYVSGLTKRTAENIVKFRDKNGKFGDRDRLKKVPGVGEVAYEQAAGFLRIAGGKNPLDNTGIHPESYTATHKLLEMLQSSTDQSAWRETRQKIRAEKRSLENVAAEIGVGIPTLEDILGDLEKPGRDPRDEMQKPLFKSDVLKIEDLHEGMMLKGTVRNVVDFGAFIDIGIKRDGLVHVSQMADRFIKNPLDIVQVGDVVDVKVVEIDLQRGRVKLSMKK